MSEIVKVSRRDFLKVGALAGGGLILGFHMTFFENPAPSAQPGAPVVPNAFIRIGKDNAVTLIVNKSEMGQGVYTSLPMLIAEELDCDWASVRVEPALVDPVYNNPLLGAQATGGSTSIRSEWDRTRKVGAAAREMLIAAAADTWKVDKASCRTEKGSVIHTSGKSLTYGQLAEKAAKLPVPESIPLKDPSDYKIVGKPTPRLDSPVKVNGRAGFGMDTTLPGMLIALIARPPVFGAKVRYFEAGKASAVPGVRRIVEIDAGIAVVADSFWSAKKARRELEINWDLGPLATLSSEDLGRQYLKMAEKPGLPARKEGDVEKELAASARQFQADYQVPYLAHACMEPLNCVVDLKSDRCEIWAGTQAQTLNRNDAAKVAGINPEQVQIHTTYLGGGFGRRGNPHSDFVVSAVQVAKAVKKPVKVIWTREDDMRGGYYRPLFCGRLSAGLDQTGRLIAWHHTNVGQSIMRGTAYEKARVKNGIDPSSVEGAADIAYEIPNILVDLHTPDAGVPVQWWRSVGHSQNGFFVESFMDEAAHAAGKDPYEFRRTLLIKHPRHLRVLGLAAEKAGWGLPLPADRARGIAICEAYGSIVSQVAEVSASPGGDVRVHRVVCAADCGRTVNPMTIEAQMQSAIVFGLSAALYGEITIKDGMVQQWNYNDYPILRMDAMPVVEVYILPSTENPGGVGEAGTPPIAPAVANAIFAATGKRIRRLPIRPEELKRA